MLVIAGVVAEIAAAMAAGAAHAVTVLCCN